MDTMLIAIIDVSFAASEALHFALTNQLEILAFILYAFMTHYKAFVSRLSGKQKVA